MGRQREELIRGGERLGVPRFWFWDGAETCTGERGEGIWVRAGNRRWRCWKRRLGARLRTEGAVRALEGPGWGDGGEVRLGELRTDTVPRVGWGGVGWEAYGPPSL